MAESHDVAIIGAGFGGIGMAIALKQRGKHSLVILEKEGEVGGAWRDNTYPGAACDVPSRLYSFSFAKKFDWSRRFAPQAEIFAYLRQCADDYGLHPHLRFNTEVEQARFDEAAGLWHIRTPQGDIQECVAIREVFRDCPDTWVNNTKSYIGHAMGAAGALELAGNLPSFEDGMIHPTINVDRLDPQCELPNLVLNQPREHGRIIAILNNSFGMLGINSSLVVKRFDAG